MTVKFLVDVGVGTKVEQWLITNGYDVKTIRAIDPKLPDRTILQMAASENRIVITMDKDFGQVVYRTAQHHTGVLLLQLEAATSEEKARVVAQIIQAHADKLEGKFTVYQSGRLGIR